MKLKYIKDPESNLIADLQRNWSLFDTGDKIVLRNNEGVSRYGYSTLEEFAKEWKTVKEPLLKGDLRRAIRVWLDYCNAKLDDKLYYYEYETCSRLRLYTKDNKGIERTYCFEMAFKMDALEDAVIYTVEQLVGTE